MSTTLTGASDDLIELDGDIYEEFTANDAGNYIAFSNGTVVRIVYGDEGIWRITPVAGGADITQCPEGDDGEVYTDVATIEGATWAVCGTDFAKAKPTP